MFKEAAALTLIAALSGSTHIGNSNVSFKEALGACPGTLGAVSFAAGHARIIASAGVETDESLPDKNGTINVMLQDASGKKTARVRIDQKGRMVYAKNVRTEMRGNVACVLPD